MITQLLQEIEDLIGSDYFQYDMEEKMELIKQNGAGIETVTPILEIMERHPLEDFGMPGAMVHFAESFGEEYKPLLISSLKKRPSMHTVWMLNRCINGSANKDEYIALLKEISELTDIEKEIRDSAEDFYKFQLGK
ncbi:MAG: hypothetical protein IJD85_01785 [Oscillospiraceae bacterium]|nr:hypothetical protein [Oscillospiraceae bacterium]